MSQTVHRTEEISSTVVEKVAAAAGQDPMTLNPPLYDVINPDALDMLCASASDEFRAVFEYAGYLVTVHGDGTVDVDESVAQVKLVQDERVQ